MKLYELSMRAVAYYDEAQSMIVRAIDPAEARQLASEAAKDEGADVWMNRQKSTCKIIKRKGPAEVLMVDMRAG